VIPPDSPLCTCLDRQSDRSRVDHRINASRVEGARSPDGKDNILRQNDFQRILFSRFCVDEDCAAAAFFPVLLHGQQGDGDAFFADFDSAVFHFPDQGDAHVAGGVGPAACRAAFRIVIGLVADILPEGIVRKRDSQRDKMVKRQRRKSRLHQRQISMNRSSVHQVPGEQGGGVGFETVHAEFVIGLLVASRVDGGSHPESLGVDGDRLHAERMEPESRGKTGGSASDDKSVEFSHIHSAPARQNRSIVSPPSILMTWPVE